MLNAISTLNGWADRWSAAMLAVVWQSAVLVVAATLIAWCLRRSSPTLRYWLWQIVAIKLLVMPFWTFYVPLPAWLKAVPATPPAVMQPAETRGSALESVATAGLLSLRETARVRADDKTPNRLAETLAAITWPAWLLVGWFAIVAGQTFRLLVQSRRLGRLLKQAIPANDAIAALVAELAGEVKLRRVPAVVLVNNDCPLFVCGLWQPTLVMPSRLLASLSSAERRQVILHELAHVKRRDLFWGWPVEIARTIYFFNPLVYWVGYQLRLERELACDQLAMARSGHPPADYAQTLINVVSHVSEPVAVRAAAISAELTGDRE